jgi:plasmid maintenance system antidote protein VapI
MDEKEKIERIMNEFNLNSAQFAAEIGIQGSTLSHILNGRNRPSLDVMKKIMSRFSSINPEWLILDKDSMFRQEKNSQEPTLFDTIDQSLTESVKYAQKSEINNVSENDSFQNKLVNKPETLSQPEFLAPPHTNEIPRIQEMQKSFSKTAVKIIVYYDDNTFQEFRP